MLWENEQLKDSFDTVLDESNLVLITTFSNTLFYIFTTYVALALRCLNGCTDGFESI